MAEADFCRTWTRSWAAGPPGSPVDLNDTYYSELTEYFIHEHVRVRGMRTEVDLEVSHRVSGQWAGRVEV